jgi:hypothetical protein
LLAVESLSDWATPFEIMWKRLSGFETLDAHAVSVDTAVAFLQRAVFTSL